MSKVQTTSALAEAMCGTLMSPNVIDTNGESANVVDALAGLGNGIKRSLANRGEGEPSVSVSIGRVADALMAIAEAIRSSK